MSYRSYRSRMSGGYSSGGLRPGSGPHGSPYGSGQTYSPSVPYKQQMNGTAPAPGQKYTPSIPYSKQMGKK